MDWEIKEAIEMNTYKLGSWNHIEMDKINTEKH